MDRQAHRGTSSSSATQRARVAKLFDDWRATLTQTEARNLAPAPIASIQTADALAKRETYERFGKWLVEEYVKPSVRGAYRLHRERVRQDRERGGRDKKTRR